MLIGIYPRKLFFFLFIGLLAFGGVKVSRLGFANLKSIGKVSADAEESDNQSKKIGQFYLEIALQKDGSAIINGKTVGGVIKPQDQVDELRYVVLRQPLDTYSTAEVKVKLPDNQLKRLAKDPQTIAVHGANPILAQLSGDTITYKAENVGDSAIMTIAADFPKGYFGLSTSAELSRSASLVPPVTWVFLGIVLPPLALVFVFMMLFGSRFQLMSKKVEGEVATLPSKISPALVSIMTHGKVTPHTIMATLVDLANRGWVDIYNRGEDFVIYKRDLPKGSKDKLRNFEKLLLDKIFLPKQKSVGSEDVEERMARHLFSRKIAQIFLEVYQEGVDLGYFIDSPAKIHLKYRMIGIGAFFIGLIGYLIFAISAADPKFVLFFWLALTLMGVLIVNLAPTLTGFSPKGEQLREQWLKLRNFMSAPKLLEGYEPLFEAYFPYAIALDCEIDWAVRFSASNFVIPKWYDYTGQLNGVENFAKSFLPILDYLGKNLSSSSDPLVR
jgi:hypothetical protein